MALGSFMINLITQSIQESIQGLFKKLLLVSLIGLLAWAYQATRPPPPKICGTPDGPPITAPRIKLSDGRHLAYKEHGVPKDKAKYKFIYIHGFDSCRHHAVVANYLSPETVDSLGIYIVAIDRPGYCESDPSPNWTVKSIALDVEEFADKLELGEKFYLIGFSMGGQAVWSCLKYIPHRLAGATLLAPAVNHWWSGLPANLSAEVFNAQIQQDRWALRVAHYAPWLTYWWNTQKLFPPIGVIAHTPKIFSSQDKELIAQYVGKEDKSSVKQQGEYESLHRDLILGFGTWEFDPTELKNPFPNNEGSVHLWQGDEDILAPVKLQRYIAEKLPWIHYHEIQGAGHLFPYVNGMSDTIIKTQLSVED
ncbi:putative 2-succinyl-6-hydroxy-2 4-cyclohexadiene-1-carboxylate synthase [Bienertia sinuspersici]